MKIAWMLRAVLMNGMEWREEVGCKERNNQGNEKHKQHNNKHSDEREGVKKQAQKKGSKGKCNV